MGTRDNIVDLLEKIESQDIQYYLVLMEDKNTQVLTSLSEDNQKKVLEFIKNSSDKIVLPEKKKTKKVDKRKTS